MGRNVQVRASYQNDASYLTRLVKAVELDEKRPIAWKKKVIAALNVVVISFLQATEEDLSPQKSKAESRKG
jgi:hypothetical protein